jgi:pectate lyase-like protein
MQRRSLLAAGSMLAAAGAATTSARAAFTSTTTTTKAQPSIFDFGAKGDGITDDSAAFNAALKAAASKGQVILVPSYTYLIANPISWTSTTDVVQPWGLLGMGATLRSGITNGSDVMSLTSNNTVRYFNMSGIKIQCTGSDGNGLHISALSSSVYFYNAAFHEIYVEGAGKHGLLFEGDVFESSISNSYFQDNKQNGATFAQSHGGVCSAISIVNCYFNQNGASGLVCTNFDAQYGGTTDVRVYGGYCRDNQQFGFYYNNGTNGACIDQVGFENNCKQLSPGDQNGAHVYGLSAMKMRDCNGYNMYGGATYLLRGWFNGQTVLEGCQQAAGGAMAATGLSALVQVNGSNTGNVLMRACNGNVVVSPGTACTWQAVNCTGTSPTGSLNPLGTVTS